MNEGKLLGKGMTAEVYKWGSSRVLKLFFDGYGDDRIQYEAKIGDIVHEAGVPSPCIFDIIEVNGRKGIVFQRIFGKTLSKHIEVKPWKICYYAKQMAGLHYKIHKYSADRLPSQKERLAIKIRHSSKILGDKGKRILEYMESLPNGNSICHGDIHFNNIIVSEKGLVAVDWNSACKGNPSGDVARTCLMIISPPSSFGALDITNILSYYTRRLICSAYLHEYIRLAKIRLEDIDAWILPVAAAKLKDKRPGEKKWLMNIIDIYMEEYNV